jgi:hypothetical protein
MMHSLATASNQPIAHPRYEADSCGAFAPNGTVVAVQADSEDTAFVDTVDLITGVRRRLWSGAGRARTTPSITWSADGRFIAATYITDDDTDATIVLDNDGTTVGRFDRMEILPGSGCAWLNDHELLLVPEFWEGDGLPLAIVDVATGWQREHTLPEPCHCRGAIDGRLIIQVPDTGLFFQDLHGSPAEPFLCARSRPQTRVLRRRTGHDQMPTR